MRRHLLFLSTLFLIMTLAACNSSRQADDNPFFTEWDTQYGVPPFDKIRTEHYMPAFERAMSLHDAEIEAIIRNKDMPSFENVVVAYDRSGEMLSQVNLVFGMLGSSDNDDQMQAIQEKVMPMLAAHRDKILLNDDLFAKIKSVYDNRSGMSLSPDQMRLVEKTYDAFVRAGALLEGKQKDRLKEVNGELSLLTVKFGNNVLSENKKFSMELSEEDLAGLPLGVRDAAKEKAAELGLNDQYVFTLDQPSMIPFLTYSDKRDLREKIYKAYINRGNNGDKYDNKQVINDIVRLRNEKAHLLGYDSYSAYVVDNQMAKTTGAVYDLLEGIYAPALDRAKGELAQMDEMLQAENPGARFESWDWWYYAEKLRRRDHSLDEEMLRPYFSLDNVRNGIFFLANRLYGITFRPVVVPLYNKECFAYEVLDTDNSHLGVLFLDFFPRNGKNGGAWCGYFREQSYVDGKRVSPIVGIVCNFTRPVQNTPALLNIDETETFFHEFGHALHFLFHDVKYRGLSEVEGDFVELPSQVMENWAFEPQMLAQYATHYRTNDQMPSDLVQKIRDTRLFNQGFMTTELIAASLSDMDIHSIKDYKQFDVNAFEKNALAERRGLIPQIEPRYHYTYFNHIFGSDEYASGYYFYTWAAVLDKDAFQAFVDSGDIFNPRIAHDFRFKLLSRGGSADGMTLYHDFRGADPDKKAMLRSRGLIKEEPTEQPEVTQELHEN